jgi:hypothetical protein
MANKHIPTLPNYDLSFFADVAQLIEQEPMFERDKVMGECWYRLALKKAELSRHREKSSQR